jgi:hypothetical protein
MHSVLTWLEENPRCFASGMGADVFAELAERYPNLATKYLEMPFRVLEQLKARV